MNTYLVELVLKDVKDNYYSKDVGFVKYHNRHNTWMIYNVIDTSHFLLFEDYKFNKYSSDCGKELDIIESYDNLYNALKSLGVML